MWGFFLSPFSINYSPPPPLLISNFLFTCSSSFPLTIPVLFLIILFLLFHLITLPPSTLLRLSLFLFSTSSFSLLSSSFLISSSSPLPHPFLFISTSSSSSLPTGVFFRVACAPHRIDTRLPSTGGGGTCAGSAGPCTGCRPISCPGPWQPVCQSTEQVPRLLTGKRAV